MDSDVETCAGIGRGANGHILMDGGDGDTRVERSQMGVGVRKSRYVVKVMKEGRWGDDRLGRVSVETGSTGCVKHVVTISSEVLASAVTLTIRLYFVSGLHLIG